MDTIKTLNAPVIVITDKAGAKITELIAREGDENIALRIAVRAGGCSGFSYDIFFDTDVDPADHKAVFGTVTVLVDPASAEHIAGSTLDFKDGLQDNGFHIENPNAQRSCGCGDSFS
jgi:iron-sulfur cluster assembly protein/iron-sulfur cluster insertion protein